MKNLFSYDSPITQLLMYIGDLIILNVIFILCCCPIFTIGAAQAGLYTAMRVLQDKEDDTSVVAAFFRGFKSGFGQITLAWGILLVMLVGLGFACMYAYAYGLPAWLCIAPIAIVALFQSLITAFHSRFGCTAWQLYRNSWFLLIAHPIRSIGIAALTWLPVILFFIDPYTFMLATPVWATLYYSIAFSFCAMFLRKPFATLVEAFNEKQAETEETETVEPETVQ